jgi:hypothetical protein
MSVKNDLMKQIEASVQRKKQVAKDLTRNKTIATWVSDFFSAVEKTRALDQFGYLDSLEVQKLENNLRTLDRRVYITFNQRDANEPVVEIHWSNAYILLNQCDPVIAMTEATAFFEKTMES